jgi:hypothetical protein
MPLYEYDHMLGWAKVERHVADELTLLCRQHHGERTAELLPIETVRQANADPYNRRTGVSRNILLHYSGQDVRVRVADSLFECRGLPDGAKFAAVAVDGLPMIGFSVEQQRLLLQFVAFDEFNRAILQIKDGELVYDTAQWDIEWVGKTLTLREGRRRILLQLVFIPPTEIVVSRGRILRNGVELLIGRNYIFNTNNANCFASLGTMNLPVGISLGEPLLGPAGFVFTGIRRYNVDRVAGRKVLKRFLEQRRRRGAR